MMIENILSPTHLLLILAVALIVLGPKAAARSRARTRFRDPRLQGLALHVRAFRGAGLDPDIGRAGSRPAHVTMCGALRGGGCAAAPCHWRPKRYGSVSPTRSRP